MRFCMVACGQGHGSHLLRALAIQYGLARGTIVNAFEQLKSEGYIEGSVGSGTQVNKVLPERLLQISPGPPSV